jgi:Tautomerase enzyme
MVQVKIYGLKPHLTPIKSELSDLVHSCVVDSLNYPPEKRFQRFFLLDPADFIYPVDRTPRYTIIEISMIDGRSVEVKKHLIRLLFERLPSLGIDGNDLEITIFENPKSNWGFRGLPGDEHQLSYKI